MKFQYIFLTLFGAMAVIAVIVFAKAPAKSSNSEVAGASGNVVIWGTFTDGGDFGKVINNFNKQYQKSFTISYQYHDPVMFDRDIVEALASRKGPDILLLPDNLILRHSDKIELLPYATIPPLTYKSLFVQAGEIYMRDGGYVAIPFAIDPIVMYWNRDLFDNASITQPPQFWDEFLTLTPKLTKRNPKTQDITQSALSFGEYVNVNNAKELLAMLFLQVGNPIVTMSGLRPTAKLVARDNDQFVPNEDVVSAFRFYMDFSNPLKNIYTWSRALSSSRDQFVNGNLAVYFDYASAYRELKAKNPHLNFAVAQVPQPRNTKTEITFARMHGLAVLKSSTNKQTAFIAVQRLLDTTYAGGLASAFNLPPVRRDLLANRPTDAVLSVLYDAAIRARTWLDPRPEDSDKAFQAAVEGVSSGRHDVSTSIIRLNSDLLSALAGY